MLNFITRLIGIKIVWPLGLKMLQSSRLWNRIFRLWNRISLPLWGLLSMIKVHILYCITETCHCDLISNWNCLIGGISFVFFRSAIPQPCVRFHNRPLTSIFWHNDQILSNKIRFFIWLNISSVQKSKFLRSHTLQLTGFWW